MATMISDPLVEAEPKAMREASGLEPPAIR